MTRKRIREELTWGVATLVAAPLCVAALPLMLLLALVDWLRGAR